jgi:predicted ATPase
MTHPINPPSRLQVRLVSLHVAGYRSIRAATLHLSPITLLVGANGVGKSNLLDALAFFTDAITLGLPQAINLRGGVQGLRHRVASPNGDDHPADAISFEAVVHVSGHYAVVNATDTDEPLKCEPFERESTYRFTLRIDPEGRYRMEGEIPTAPLVLAFTRYTFDDLQALRRSQRYEPVTVLDARGQYLNSVWYEMERAHGEAAARVVELLAQVVPGVEAIKAVKVSRFLEVEVTLRGEDGRRQVLPLDSMSDGFVWAFAVLVAVYQPNRPDLIALDEVEASLHPAAAARLFLALQSAPEPMPQLLLTTHSPALLDSGGVSLDMLRVVAWRDGETRVGPIAAAQVALIQQRLVTGAELLAEGALRMDDAP